MIRLAVMAASARNNGLFLLVALSLCYLALPYLIFFGGWFSPAWSVILLTVVAQDDHPPVSRAVSTSLWRPGLTLPDFFRLDIAAVGPGTYRILLGLYDPLTGARVRLTPPGTGDAYLVADVTLPLPPSQ